MGSPAGVLCRTARKEAGLSQRELAARSGVSPSTVARIERERMEPTLDLLMRLVRACGFDLRMRLTPDDVTDRMRSRLDFADRVIELQRLSDFAIQARER